MPKSGYAVMVMALALNGCCNLHIESVDDYLPPEKTADVSVSVRKFDDFQARLKRTGPRSGLFSLVCLGAYEVKRERTVSGRRLGDRALAVGFFPGMFALSEGMDGTAVSKWPGQGIRVLVMNVGLCGFPTLASLLYGPFDSYQDADCGWMSSRVAEGLVGCCKWRQFKKWEKDVEEHDVTSRIVSEYQLTGYEVVIDGVRRSCIPPARDILVDVPSDKKSVSVVIKRVPLLSGGLERWVNGLTDLELEVTVQ